MIDLPGGGAEEGETPFMTLCRETMEEFGLTLEPEHIVYAKKNDSVDMPGTVTFFVVVKLPQEAERDIVFGDEGLEWMLLSEEEFFAREDGIAWLQKRAVEAMNAISTR